MEQDSSHNKFDIYIRQLIELLLYQLSHFKLASVERRVKSAQFQKFRMTAPLHNIAIPDYENQIGILDCR